MHTDAHKPYFHHETSALSMSDNASSDFQRGLAALEAGDRSGAFSGFLMALAQEPDNTLYRQHALDILGTTGGYASLPDEVLSALARCADDASLDLQPLALVLKTLLPYRPETEDWLRVARGRDSKTYTDGLRSGLFDNLATDPLVGVVLRRTTNVSLILEDILTGMRRHMLTTAAIDGSTPVQDRHPDFAEALILQAERSDFAWAESEEETALLNKLDHSPQCQMVRAAYRRAVPQTAPNFVQFTPISDLTSQRVQSQYTNYPYPRWESVPLVKPACLQDIVTDRFPKEVWPDRFTGALDGLSAGCGTGRGAIMLAQSVKDLNLTAMDLSPTSLTFAADQAAKLQVSNISFGVGDILELSGSQKTYDIIECSGVLHHMNDPLAGLVSLRSCLKADGVMRIALYSDRARASVVAARHWVESEELQDSPSDLRQARTALRALPDRHPAKAVIETPDFFNLSGLHDLIFNVQEHRFTPQGLKHLLEQAGLRFLGFDHFNLAVSSQFEAMFSADADKADLDKWETFEQNHPDTFSEMYQLWCRPIT